MKDNAKKNTLISVIIPIYNSEIYLSKCIDSLINQTYDNIEIILVDDGSTDNSAKIINQYVCLDQRVRAFFVENHGPSYARNHGISVSQGEYISFVDSDDYVEPSYISDMVSNINNAYYDLIISGMRIIEKKLCINSSLNSLYYSKYGLLKDIVLNCDLNYLWGPCAKLIRKNILSDNNILFDEKSNFAEDLVFFIQVLNKTNNFTIVNTINYNYIKHKNSITGNAKNNFDDVNNYNNVRTILNIFHEEDINSLMCFLVYLQGYQIMKRLFKNRNYIECKYIINENCKYRKFWKKYTGSIKYFKTMLVTFIYDKISIIKMF